MGVAIGRVARITDQKFRKHDQRQIARIGELLVQGYNGHNAEPRCMELYQSVGKQVYCRVPFIATVAYWIGLYVSEDLDTNAQRTDSVAFVRNFDSNDWLEWAYVMITEMED